MGYSVSCVCVVAVPTLLPIQLLHLLYQYNWMLWRGDVHSEFYSFQVRYCANLLSILCIPSFNSSTSNSRTERYQAQASLLRNARPLSQLATYSYSPNTVSSHSRTTSSCSHWQSPLTKPNYSRESPICLPVAARAASIAAGSSPCQQPAVQFTCARGRGGGSAAAW